MSVSNGQSERTPPRNRSLKGVLLACGGALALHLVPLFLPRNMPEQDLAIARAIPDAANRVKVLKPLRDSPKATGAELREAAELLRDGSPLDAYELAVEADRREPGVVETHLLLARLCHGQRMSRCEEESLTKAEREAPGDPRALLLRADFQEHAGDLTGALKSVERAYAKAPGREGVGVRYARLLSGEGRGEEALEILRKQERSLGVARLRLEEGRVRVAQGRVEEGRTLFARAVEEDPKLAAGHYALGMAAIQLGDLAAAEDALREADRLEVKDPRPLTALCELYRRAGRADEVLAVRMDLERRFAGRMEAVQTACQTP